MNCIISNISHPVKHFPTPGRSPAIAVTLDKAGGDQPAGSQTEACEDGCENEANAAPDRGSEEARGRPSNGAPKTSPSGVNVIAGAVSRVGVVSILAGGVGLGEAAEGGVVVAGAELVQAGGVVEPAAGVFEVVVDVLGLGAADAVGVVAVAVDLGADALGADSARSRCPQNVRGRPSGGLTAAGLKTRRLRPGDAPTPALPGVGWEQGPEASRGRSLLVGHLRVGEPACVADLLTRYYF